MSSNNASTEPVSQVVDCSTLDPHPTDPAPTILVNGRTIGVRHVCADPPRPPPAPRPNPLATVEPMNGLEATLLRWPERMWRLEEAHWNAMHARQAMREGIAAEEAKIRASIWGTGDDGKPRFANEGQREAQLKVSVAANGDVQRIRTQLDEQDAIVARLEREIARYTLEFKAAYGLTLSRARLTMEVKF